MDSFNYENDSFYEKKISTIHFIIFLKFKLYLYKIHRVTIHHKQILKFFMKTK